MSGDTSCKIIVRQLNFDTKDEDLKEFYEKWGTVEDCKIMRHQDTKKSRGFGIIRFVKASSVDEAIAARPHELDGRKLEPHRASPREYSQKPESKHVCNEIFVGGWKPEIEEEDLKEYFGQYGTILEVTIPKDKKDETKYRGFAVIKFDDYDPVDVCCYKKLHYIKENKLMVSKWINWKDMKDLNQKYGRRDDREMQNGGGGGDLQSQILQQLVQSALGGGGGYQGNSFEGPMKKGNRGNNKPYGRKW